MTSTSGVPRSFALQNMEIQTLGATNMWTLWFFETTYPAPMLVNHSKKALGIVETHENSGRVRLTHYFFWPNHHEEVRTAIRHSQKTEFDTALKSNVDNYLDT